MGGHGHIATAIASQRRGPPHFRLRSEPREWAVFRIESSGYTRDGVAPGRKPYCGDQTICSPSTGHGPCHSAWEGFQTIRLYQELSLRGGRIALGLPRLLIAQLPSRPNKSMYGPVLCTSTFGVCVGARVACAQFSVHLWPVVLYTG